MTSGDQMCAAVGAAVFEEMKRYVQLDGDDEAALRRIHVIVHPELERITSTFYRRLLDEDRADLTPQQGESQSDSPNMTFGGWLDKALQGPWNDEYFQQRCRIGRLFVRIQPSQQRVFAAMNAVRRELDRVLDARARQEASGLRASLSKILDIELSIMTHVYCEDVMARSSRSERLTTFGQLAAGLSHEIRNPLNAALLQLTVLERRLHKVTAEDLRASLMEPMAVVRDEIRRLDQVLKDFLKFARPRDIDSRPVDLRDVGRRVLDLLQTEAERAGVTIERELGEVPAVLGEESALQQVVMSLMLNALQVTPPGGKVRLGVVGSEADAVSLVVEDAGPGVPDELRERIFEPFFSTRQMGSGLGLAIVHTIVTQHHGHVSVDVSELGGARFVVRLPAALSSLRDSLVRRSA